MSDSLVDSVRATAAASLVETTGAQWSDVGYLGSQVSRVREVCLDPEALLVMTFEAARHDPTLDQALAWWAVRGVSLQSLPRLGYVLRVVSEDLRAEVGRFAARVAGVPGASPSWKRRATLVGAEPIAPPERLKGTAVPYLLRQPEAMLRMRAIAGVGLKADLIAFLASRPARPSTISTISKALGASDSSIRPAIDEMARAGVATGQLGSPASYLFRPGVLSLGDVPPWRFWPQIASFLIGAARWGESLREPTPFLLSVEARALYERLMAFGVEHPLPTAYPISDPAAHPGPSYLEPFAGTVASVTSWIRDGLPSGA